MLVVARPHCPVRGAASPAFPVMPLTLVRQLPSDRIQSSPYRGVVAKGASASAASSGDKGVPATPISDMKSSAERVKERGLVVRPHQEAKQHAYPSRPHNKEAPISPSVPKDAPAVQSTSGERSASHLPNEGRGDADVFSPCSGHNAAFVATSSENKVLLDLITSLVQNDINLKNVVKQCFNEVVDDSHGIDVNGMQKFRSLASRMLGVPEAVFPGIRRQHLRFDLDGSERLGQHELFMLVKMNLWEHRKKLAKYSSGVTIHDKSPTEAGYSILKELGHGNQSKANLGKDRAGNLLCVKTYDKAKMKTLDLESLKQEYEVLQHLGQHRNIAAVSELFQDVKFYYMVQELCQGGDFTTLKQRALDSDVSTNESWWRTVFRQCFEGLMHIHDHALMHGDIKESNLMLKTDKYSQPAVVIIDFGLVQTAVSDARVVWGTPGYIAPETWETGKAYPGGDIFAMGVVIMQMLLDKIPPHHDPPKGEVLPRGIFTDGLRTMQEVGMFTRSRTPPFGLLAADFPQLPLLARQLLEKEVLRRPCARKVLQDAWFTQPLADDAFSELVRKWFG